jgi:ParB-like chromosome segregation protein Spo0J
MIVTEIQTLQDRLDLLENQALQDQRDLLDLRVRMAFLENKALQENQGLSDLLGRLEIVIASARQFWSRKTTQLKWMIAISVLIATGQLTLLYLVIATTGMK